MAEWQHRINLAGVLSAMGEKHDLSRVEEDCPEEVKEALAVEIRKAPPISHFAGRIKRAKSIAAVNRALAALYDDADRWKVWCGL